MKKSSNFAKKNASFFILKIDICWQIKQIPLHYMRKHILSMRIKFEVDSLICSRVSTAAIFETVVSRKMRLKLSVRIFLFYGNILDLTVILQDVILQIINF